jgi:diketogulonate reductase-like aldo/keto reductase
MAVNDYAGLDVSSATLKIGEAAIPALGFGTYGMSGAKLQTVLVEALKQGFRHIDTAQIYDNEADIGLAIRAAGVPRQRMFITTKVWVGNYSRSRFISSVDESLANLKTDYVDLLLVHWPRGGAGVEEQIEGLNRAVETGRVRHIGVSNYNAEMLDRAAALSRYPIVSNQVEYHPFLDQTAVLAHIAAGDSSLMAYCGMAVGRVFKTNLLSSIAARRQRSIAQVVLRWLIQQHRVVALSRTETVERIRPNSQIFDFALADDEMAAISALHAPGSRIVNPPHLAPDWD